MTPVALALVGRQDEDLAEAKAPFVRVKEELVQGGIANDTIVDHPADAALLEDKERLPHGVGVVDVGGAVDVEEEKVLDALVVEPNRLVLKGAAIDLILHAIIIILERVSREPLAWGYEGLVNLALEL
jgi:hypothetical protein